LGRRDLQARWGSQDHKACKGNQGRLGRKGREACQVRKGLRDPAVPWDRPGLWGRPDLKDHKECRVCWGRRGQQDRKDPSGPWVTPACQDKEASPVPRAQPVQLAPQGPREQTETLGRLDRLDRREIPGQQDRLGASASQANWGRPDLPEQPVAGAIPVRTGRQGRRDRLETLELWGRQAHRALKESRRLSPAPLVQRVRLARQAPRANLVLRASQVRKGSPVLRAN
jgi:hypothetical protein